MSYRFRDFVNAAGHESDARKQRHKCQCPDIYPNPYALTYTTIPIKEYKYDHRPVQLVFLSWSSTSVKLLKLCTRMTFLSLGALAMLSSSIWNWTSFMFPMPSEITFVRLPPTIMSFSLLASAYNLRRNMCNVEIKLQTVYFKAKRTLPLVWLLNCVCEIALHIVLFYSTGFQFIIWKTVREVQHN